MAFHPEFNMEYLNKEKWKEIKFDKIIEKYFSKMKTLKEFLIIAKVLFQDYK